MTADLRIERRIRQTPEACFDLWMRPDEVAKWWGPKDEAGLPFSAEVHAWSALPGAVWSVTMTAPDGAKYFQEGLMLEIVRPRLLRFSFAWISDGQRGPATEVRLEFRPDGLGTHLIFQHIGFVDAATRDGHDQGWQDCLDRLCALAEDSVDAGK
jgi:uncharacterized protein YndB with AHSA1/START domain